MKIRFPSKARWHYLILLAGLSLYSQECPVITFPEAGETEIPVDATFTWEQVEGINGYLINVGTFAGGDDIIKNRAVGIVNLYKPPLGLPENTELYLSLSLLLFDGPPIACASIPFQTIDIVTPPPCSVLVAPDNNATNVTIVTDISWSYASTATYYHISIGTTPAGSELLNNLNVGNILTYEPEEPLPQDTQIFVTVIPWNENGSGGSCQVESFFTGGIVDLCEPSADPETGETIQVRPMTELPERIGLCSDALPYLISTPDNADGYRWYRINAGAQETLLSEQREVPITAEGRYRYEAYNRVVRSGNTVECAVSRLFTVVVSEIAVIEDIEVTNLAEGRMIRILARGMGSYEYAIGSPDGPYQDDNFFTGISPDAEHAYVRDRNGCGIAEGVIDRDITLDDFPNFFTPNADGVNDFWAFIPPRQDFGIVVYNIAIYDRYGLLIAQIEPGILGWDGRYNGQHLPSSDYWFLATASNGQVLKGHFALKR